MIGLNEIKKVVTSYSLFGLVRYFRLKIMGRELLVVGSCKQCGSCCSCINLEGRKGWLRYEADFVDVVREYPEYARFMISGRDKQGFLQFSCSWLGTGGLCKDHEHRLSLCRNFPDKSLHFCGGTLPKGCGYSIREVRPFKKYLKDELGG